MSRMQALRLVDKGSCRLQQRPSPTHLKHQIYFCKTPLLKKAPEVILHHSLRIKQTCNRMASMTTATTTSHHHIQSSPRAAPSIPPGKTLFQAHPTVLADHLHLWQNHSKHSHLSFPTRQTPSPPPFAKQFSTETHSKSAVF